MEEAAQLEEARAERKERIFKAYEAGQIFEGKGRGEVVDQINAATDPQLKKWEDQVDEAEREQIDNEEVQAAQQALRPFALEPDDPQYDYIFDPELRRKTEEGLDPIDFAQMVFDGYAEQVVPIRPNFKVTYRTISTMHGLWLERKIHEAHNFAQEYGRHWFSMLQLAVSVQQINGKDIGADLSSFDEEAHNKAFWDTLQIRLKSLARLPVQITDLIICNFVWFSGRVRKELVGEIVGKVGNSSSGR